MPEPTYRRGRASTHGDTVAALGTLGDVVSIEERRAGVSVGDGNDANLMTESYLLGYVIVFGGSSPKEEDKSAPRQGS